MSEIKGSMEEVIHLKRRRNEEQEALRKALEGIKLECEMVGIAQGKMDAILLCDKVIADWEACIKWMDEQPIGIDFDAMEVADRALQSIMNLAAALQWGEEEVEMQPLPQPAKVEDAGVGVLFEDEAEAEDQEHDGQENGQLPYAERRDEALELHVIQMMAMAGTEKDGSGAWWTVENLQYGLVKLHPDLTEWDLRMVLAILEQESVVKEVKVPRKVGAEVGYVLADEHAGPAPKRESVESKIILALESAKDDSGNYMAWTRNQVWFAVKRTDASLSRTVFEEALKEMARSGAVIVHEGARNTYVALAQEDMDRFLRLAIERGVEPTGEASPAPEPTPTPRPATPPPSTPEESGVVLEKVEAEKESPEVAPIDEMTWEKVETMMGISGDTFTSTNAGAVLSEMRKQRGRLWRDYDLEGLFKGRTEPLTMTAPDGEDGSLKKALGQLIGMKLVEHLPRDSRPGLHEERWGLTELGRVS